MYMYIYVCLYNYKCVHNYKWIQSEIQNVYTTFIY